MDLEVVVRRYFDAVNEHRFDDVAAMLSPDAEFVAPMVGALRGPEAIVGYIRAAVRPFAVHRDEAVRVHVAGSVVTAEIAFTGRLPAGDAVAFAAVDIFDLAEDGRIARVTNWYDSATVRDEMRRLAAARSAV